MALATRHAVEISTDPIEFCYKQGWTDGLPVIPPTPERVEAMLSGTTLPRETVVAKIPPSWLKPRWKRSRLIVCLPDVSPVICR